MLSPSVCWTDEFGLDDESPFGAEEFEVPPPPFVRDGEEEDEVVARIVQNQCNIKGFKDFIVPI